MNDLVKVWMNGFPGVTLRASLPLTDSDEPPDALAHTYRAMLAFGQGFIKPLSADLTIRTCAKDQLPWFMGESLRQPTNHSGHFFLKTDQAPGNASPAWIKAEVETCSEISEESLKVWSEKAFATCHVSSPDEEMLEWESFAFRATSVRLPALPSPVPDTLFVSGSGAGEGDHHYKIISDQDGYWVSGTGTGGAAIVLDSNGGYGEIRLTIYLRWSPWSGRTNSIHESLTLDGRSDIEVGRKGLERLGWKIEE